MRFRLFSVTVSVSVQRKEPATLAQRYENQKRVKRLYEEAQMKMNDEYIHRF